MNFLNVYTDIYSYSSGSAATIMYQFICLNQFDKVDFNLIVIANNLIDTVYFWNIFTALMVVLRLCKAHKPAILSE